MVMSNMMVMVDEDGDGDIDGHKQGDGELTKLAPWPPKQLGRHLG